MSCGITDMSGCVKAAASSAIEALAKAIADSCAWMIKASFTWWIDTDSPGVNSNIVDQLHAVLWPVTISVAVAGMILVGIKMVASGRPDPLVSMGEALFKLAFFTTCGTATVNLMMEGSAAFSKWVLDQPTGAAFGTRMTNVFALAGMGNMFGGMILLGVVGFLAGVVQWVLGLLREGSVLILTGCLPLAAAGQLTGFGRVWLPKVFGWTLALIFWQPCASLVYYAAFKLIGEGNGLTEILIGLSMMLLAIAALPVLIKLFSWASDSVMDTGGTGSLSSLASLGASALRMQAGNDGGGAQPISATQHAQMISQNLPDPGEKSPQGATPAPGKSGQDSPSPSPEPSSSSAQPGVPGGGIPPQQAATPAAVDAGASVGAAEGTAAATSGAATSAAATGTAAATGPAAVVVVAVQEVHGAANSAASSMTTPPSE